MDRPAPHETARHLLEDLSRLEAEVAQGGGPARIQRQRDKGKMTARERIDALLDAPDQFLEIGMLAGHGMYDDVGGCPSAGTVVGLGHVSGQACIVVANDATVKAGAWFPITARKNLRAQEIALENHLPIIYLVDSAGVFLPMQADIFPDRDHFGRIFRNNAVLSAKGIPQLAAIMGSCVAGGAYLPIMSDESIIVEGTGTVFLAGPFLVKAAIGEVTDGETLGGAATHSGISGVTDHRVPDDAACIEKIRQLMANLGPRPGAGFARTDPAAPSSDPEGLVDLMPTDGRQPYDMMEIIDKLVDAESWVPYKEEYGQTILCGYAVIDGWRVGVVANQRKTVRAKSGEMRIGGVIYSDSADKAARFVMSCNQRRLPLVFLQDVTGFMVGKRAEHGGIIKDGAKLVNAVANSVVPKFTVVVGNSYGAGNYAMCGRAYDPRLMLAWPTARIAVMGGEQAAKTLAQIQVAKMTRSGSEVSESAQEEMARAIQETYDEQTGATYAAARLWVDAVIDPRQTRRWLSTGIEIADGNPNIPDFKTGVLQT